MADRMTKAEKAGMWRGRIRYAKEKRKSYFEGDGPKAPPGADFAIDVYRGLSKPKWWSDEDPWVHVGKLKAAIRAALPSLMYANPRFKVYPAAKDIEMGRDVAYERAKAKELWLNHIWSEANGQTHARIAIGNAFFMPACIKAGYLCDFQDDKDRGVFQRTEDGEYVLDDAGDPVLERGKFLTDEDGELIRDEYGIPVTHPGKLTKEKWFVECMDTHMLLFDVESGADYFQHRFIIEEWIRPLKEVQDDPRFSAAVRKRLTATEDLRGREGYRKSIFEVQREIDPDRVAVEKDEARLRGYDIYDFQNQEYLVLADSGAEDDDEFLLEGPMPKGMEHGPFRFLKYTEDIGSEWYGVPDAIDMAIVNQEYNITRSQMMIHREHTKTRYLETPGAFDGDDSIAEEERAKFAHGPDGVMIKVANSQAIFPAPKANLDGSFFTAVPNIAADFNEVGGMPGEMRGVSDADSATQASILASGAEIRNSDRRDNQVQNFLCQIGRMLLMSGQANAELDTVVMDKISDATGGILPFRPVTLTPEELLGEFEVTVEIGSTQQKNNPQRMMQAMSLLQTLSQNPGAGMYRGLIARLLDSQDFDPVLADEIAQISEKLFSQQNPPQGSPEGMTPTQQTIPTDIMGMGNAAGGTPTGAPIN